MTLVWKKKMETRTAIFYAGNSCQILWVENANVEDVFATFVSLQNFFKGGGA